MPVRRQSKRRKSRTRAITIKLPVELVERIDATAARRRTSRTVVIREMLEHSPEPRGTLLDAIGHLVGSVRGGPRDLASNPKYMRGYGE